MLQQHLRDVSDWCGHTEQSESLDGFAELLILHCLLGY